MIQVIPAILAKTEEEFRQKVEKVRPFATLVHVDVMDGSFVDHKTWAAPEKMKTILGDLPFEAHLMVSEPEHATMVWLAAGASRVFFHAEATTQDDLIVRAAEKMSDKIGIAINPETPLSRLSHNIDLFRSVMVMGVSPGRSGQPLQPITAEKIATLKQLRPSVNICVDGGVKPENIGQLIQAGADSLAVGSALTDTPNPQRAWKDLKGACADC